MPCVSLAWRWRTDSGRRTAYVEVLLWRGVHMFTAFTCRTWCDICKCEVRSKQGGSMRVEMSRTTSAWRVSESSRLPIGAVHMLVVPRIPHCTSSDCIVSSVLLPMGAQSAVVSGLSAPDRTNPTLSQQVDVLVSLTNITLSVTTYTRSLTSLDVPVSHRLSEDP